MKKKIIGYLMFVLLFIGITALFVSEAGWFPVLFAYGVVFGLAIFVWTACYLIMSD